MKTFKAKVLLVKYYTPIRDSNLILEKKFKTEKTAKQWIKKVVKRFDGPECKLCFPVWMAIENEKAEEIFFRFTIDNKS